MVVVLDFGVDVELVDEAVVVVFVFFVVFYVGFEFEAVVVGWESLEVVEFFAVVSLDAGLGLSLVSVAVSPFTVAPGFPLVSTVLITLTTLVVV